MSGGVDSSVAAALLHESGYSVTGVGLRLAVPRDAGSTPESAACCGQVGMDDARAVAARIGIPFYVLDYREAFEREVIEPFYAAYANARTPNPCILCNERLKFGILLDFALALGMRYLATGHYVRIDKAGDGMGPTLLRGVDSAHDQSYFLYSLSRYQLDHALFPLGDLSKDAVRGLARRRGLTVADKASSQDTCFAGSGGYRNGLSRRYPTAMASGPIVDQAGRELGRHAGIGAYTVGQRRGLGVSAQSPLYVLQLDTQRNAVVVGPREDTFVDALQLERVTWVEGPPLSEGSSLVVKTRYRGVESPAQVRCDADGAQVLFQTPHPMAAPGQAAVVYAGDRVLGGGVVAANPTETA